MPLTPLEKKALGEALKNLRDISLHPITHAVGDTLREMLPTQPSPMSKEVIQQVVSKAQNAGYDKFNEVNRLLNEAKEWLKIVLEEK